LFSADDLLEIEIYYNKKHLFLVSLRFLDLSDEKCRDFLFSGGDFLFSADDLLEIEIYYNKKHLFLENLFSRTTAVDFWILDLDFWSSRERFLELDQKVSLRIYRSAPTNISVIWIQII